MLRQQPAAEQDVNTVQQAGVDQAAAAADTMAIAPSPLDTAGNIPAADAAVAAAPTVDHLVGLEHTLQWQRLINVLSTMSACVCKARGARAFLQVRFVDVGCGFGGLLIRLAPLFPDKLMLGFELRDKVRGEEGIKSSMPCTGHAHAV